MDVSGREWAGFSACLKWAICSKSCISCKDGTSRWISRFSSWDADSALLCTAKTHWILTYLPRRRERLLPFRHACQGTLYLPISKVPHGVHLIPSLPRQRGHRAVIGQWAGEGGMEIPRVCPPLECHVRCLAGKKTGLRRAACSWLLLLPLLELLPWPRLAS